MCVCVRTCGIIKNGHYRINGHNPCVLSTQSHQKKDDDRSIAQLVAFTERRISHVVI